MTRSGDIITSCLNLLFGGAAIAAALTEIGWLMSLTFSVFASYNLTHIYNAWSDK